MRNLKAYMTVFVQYRWRDCWFPYR